MLSEREILADRVVPSSAAQNDKKLPEIVVTILSKLRCRPILAEITEFIDDPLGTSGVFRQLSTVTQLVYKHAISTIVPIDGEVVQLDQERRKEAKPNVVVRTKPSRRLT